MDSDQTKLARVAPLLAVAAGALAVGTGRGHMEGSPAGTDFASLLPVSA